MPGAAAPQTSPAPIPAMPGNAGGFGYFNQHPGGPTASSNFSNGGLTGGAAAGITPLQQGYQAALGNLGQSLNLAGNTTSGELQGLKTQLKANQSQVQQGLVNSGLGNSTIMSSAEQAPLQTYNQGVLNAQNQGALLQMGAYNNLASTAAAGGQAITNTAMPFQANALAKAGQVTPQITSPAPNLSGGTMVGNQNNPGNGGMTAQQIAAANQNIYGPTTTAVGGGGAVGQVDANGNPIGITPQQQYQQSQMNLLNTMSAPATVTGDASGSTSVDAGGNPVDANGDPLGS